MVNNVLKQIVIISFSCVLAACAASRERSLGDPEGAFLRGTDCISQMTIRDYSVLDDSNLIVTGTGSRRYHVALFQPAYGLRSTWQIGFSSRTGQVCSGTSDLIVSDGLGTERYNVSSIRQLTPEEYELLLVSFGKKQPPKTQAQEPEEMEGAEVEELD